MPFNAKIEQRAKVSAILPADLPVGWHLVRGAYTLFCTVLVPVYLSSYGPTNFLYFCDEALLLTLIGLWTRHPLPISMAAVGIILPQIAWVIDFVATGFDHPGVGMTTYMFDSSKPLFLRALSSFHGWLPFLLAYLVVSMGYDRRALACWTALATTTIAICFFFMPPPSPTASMTPVNIDYVWGLSDLAPQSFMPSWAWLLLLTLGMPVICSLPAHALLSRLASYRFGWCSQARTEPTIMSAVAPRG